MTDASATTQAALSAEARALMARAARADSRSRRAESASIADAFRAPEARLDDRTRAAFSALVSGIVGVVEGELSEYAARLLTARGATAAAEAITRTTAPVVDRLAAAGLLGDPDFAGECLARVRLELLTEGLPADAGAEGDAPSLLARLTQSSDRVVATAASAAMIGESHRRSLGEGRALSGTGLPSALHARLVWWVAAALRNRVGDRIADPAALDRALGEAAKRSIAAHDDDDRVEMAAMRLAAAVDPQAAELLALIDEVLRDRRLTILAAFLAHALGTDYELGRELLIDPAGDRLWLVLRALDVPREVIARLGFHLCEADARRDAEAFADALDLAASIDPATARLAVAPLTLHRDFRAALMALDAARDDA
ncbi:hypothetical protein ACFSC3_15260 [Sphingomonas floccifaciens]|uniref:DUF2336 domain-containing protein n=1 Tax=Sphingomonas floccifaciens TaxID=1844115 RepID=A0ABW4NG75_9SPHN